MKASQERTTKRALKTTIQQLQALDVLLNGVFARDDESSDSDGFSSSSLGGSAGGKGSHSDRTSDHATRDKPRDAVHEDVVQIVKAVDEMKATAQRLERIARKLTAHERSVVI